MKKLLILLFIPFIMGTTYYVRTDGGTPSQCDCTTDAALAGAPNCACIHPNWVLAPQGNNPSLLASGDTMIIGSGTYEVGYGTPNTSDTSKCSTFYPWDCYSRVIPNGIWAGADTRILGEGWDTGCTNPPEIWGSERVQHIFRFAHRTEINCLELTDHSACMYRLGASQCSESSFPYGDWALDGLKNVQNSDDITLKNLNIHGFARDGIHAGGFDNLTVDSVYTDTNGSAGWNFDENDCCSNSGDLVFDNYKSRFNACIESYPTISTDTTTAEIIKDVTNCCTKDNQGCYGDGIGTPATGGAWVFRDSEFFGNASDGLDLLYITSGGASTILRSKFVNNNGNQLKVSGAAHVEDNYINSWCDYHNDEGLAWSGGGGFTPCRAQGDALALFQSSAGDSFNVVNNTILSKGNFLISMSERQGAPNCDGTEFLELENNTLLAGVNAVLGASGLTSLIYTAELAGTCATSLDPDWGTDGSNQGFNIKVDPCGTGDSAGFDCPESDPDLVGVTIVARNSDYVCTDSDVCDVTLNAGSPSIGIGISTVVNSDVFDITGGDRGAVYDAGAYEFSTVAATCSDDCSLCLNQGTCEASAATDCNATGFCCWNTDVCETTVADVCDADHCSLCLTQTPCEAVSACEWTGSVCQVDQGSPPLATTSVLNGNFILKTGIIK